MDLLERTAALVDVASVSHGEGPITDAIESTLRGVAGLVVDRVGDNVVARTVLGRAERLILAGHTDTVPANGNERARVEGDVVWGCGAADMKGGLAVMVELAESLPEPLLDVTYVFYAGEEVAAEHNGLLQLFRDRPELLVGDVALLGEPTDGAIEAGCQGTMRVEVVLRGVRAHTARPWMGRNAIHRMGALLQFLESRQDWRRVQVEGCEYREAVSGVSVRGGVAGNVVPDTVTLTLNHRFAPDRSCAQAEAALRAELDPFIEADDGWTLIDAVEGATPGLDHPILGELVARTGLEVRAKLGWTDVARFAAHGIPASNFGPGDALLAHTAEERVTRAQLERTHAALADLLSRPREAR
ncbi:MAG: succinyl-diaminopimelate desuccinylase [Acidimicrobiales bacterium]